MAAPVDILIVAETAEIQRAFLDAEGFEWKTGRLDDGGRYDWFTAKIEGGVTWSAAVATVETLSRTEKKARTVGVEEALRPRFSVFVCNGIASADAFEMGDLLLARSVWLTTEEGERTTVQAYALANMWFEEAKFFEQTRMWRDLSVPRQDHRTQQQHAIHPVHLLFDAKPFETRDFFNTNPRAAAPQDMEFVACAVSRPTPRLIVLGTQTLHERTGLDEYDYPYPVLAHAPPGYVARNLAAFVLHFFPEQIRNGNFARATAPSAAPTNGAHDDDELAPLLRRAIDDVRVTSVTLSHFKNIRSLRLDFPTPHPTRGHWTCIAGINGAGKSAVLQAITLALLGDRLASELGGDRLQRARRHDHDGPHDAAIEVSLSAGQGTFLLRVDLDEAGVADPTGNAAEMRAFWKARPKHHLLRAYGPGRNLSEYIDKRYADRSPHVQAVMTLFDPLTQVASAEALIEKAADAGFLQHLESLANHLFQDLGVVAVIDGPSLRFASQGAQLAVVDLPDGLRATLAWIADLCFAWYAAATPAEREEGLASLRATVIVDEIDLHLHPKLQRTLVERLRERLPRVQWIVTTHSPLVLASFDREEIVLLEPDPEHGVRRRELDRQITGFTLDEIVRWLMETEPHSLALDAVAEEPVDPEQRLAFLLSLSPTVGEREAREALDAVREHRASKPPEEPSEEGT